MGPMRVVVPLVLLQGVQQMALVADQTQIRG
jgi:hypothetical protein